MFKFSDLESVHLEITNNCQARCPMCSRNYHGGLENPNIKIKDWTLEDFKFIFNQEVLTQIKSVYFCGNFGDPILNNDLDRMCEYASKINPELQIRIHTNGGAKSEKWWKSLVSKLPEKHFVIFGIDGLEDTHHLYRIGTKYQQVIKKAKAFIDSGGNAEWVFIKFKHNEHQTEEAKIRAKNLGFKLFTVKNSTRFLEKDFPVLDKEGNVVYRIEPPTSNRVELITADMIKNYKSWVKDSNIECYAKKNKEIYIDAYKNVFPCCFLASTPYNYVPSSDLTFPVRYEIRNQYDRLIESLGGISKLDAKTIGIKLIIDSDSWQNIWHHYWNEDKLVVCARTCGSNSSKEISKPKDQFIERIGFD